MTNQLKRRLFFKNTFAFGTGLTLAALASAQMGHGPQGGSMGGGMTSRRLMDINRLPSGKPINTLWRLPNTSKEAGVFRAKLTAKRSGVEFIQGVETEFWSYSDKVPGPLIEVFEGDLIEIEFENLLPQPTTVHWHGMELPADQDGGPMDLVAPGDSRVYRFTPPVGSAGTYWFHPHPHYMTAEQVFRGLAGAVIVRAKNDPLADLPEQHLIFSDLKLGADGQIVDNNMMDWMNGREGQFSLLNGQRQPIINVNEPQRWRLWNMNSARYLRLSLAGTPLTVVGTDGGLLEKPQVMQEILLAPAERVEIIVDPTVLAKVGSELTLTSEPYDRGKMMHASVDPRSILARVNVNSSDSKIAYIVPQKLRTIKPLDKAVRTRKFELTEVMDMQKMHGPFSVDGKPQGMDFLINGKSFDPKRVDVEMKRGEVETWEIYNNSDMDHPMHIHGTQFQIIDKQMRRGRWIPEIISLKDTVNVRPQETVRLKMVQNNVGSWMYHCHILEHEDLGMMGTLKVI